MTTKIGPVLSPVDYDAWDRGYCPPSEHVLIDALAYRGARVISCSHGSERGYWVVVKGDLSREARRKIGRHIVELFEILDAAEGSDVLEQPNPERDRDVAVPPASVA